GRRSGACPGLYSTNNLPQHYDMNVLDKGSGPGTPPEPDAAAGPGTPSEPDAPADAPDASRRERRRARTRRRVGRGGAAVAIGSGRRSGACPGLYTTNNLPQHDDMNVLDKGSGPGPPPEPDAASGPGTPSEPDAPADAPDASRRERRRARTRRRLGRGGIAVVI